MNHPGKGKMKDISGRLGTDVDGNKRDQVGKERERILVEQLELGGISGTIQKPSAL